MLLAAAVTAAVMLSREGRTQPARRPVPAVAAAGDAHQACLLVQQLFDLVDADATATQVEAVAERARRLADEAAFASPKWVPVDAAAQALATALEHDDTRLAAVGSAEAGPACAGAGVRLSR